jgi:hypothetical protein
MIHQVLQKSTLQGSYLVNVQQGHSSNVVKSVVTAYPFLCTHQYANIQGAHALLMTGKEVSHHSTMCNLETVPEDDNNGQQEPGYLQYT